MTSVLEKLKALDAQRAQLLEGAKKEALDNAEKAVAELNELGFPLHASLRAHQRQQERHAKLPLKLQSAKRETCPALYAISKRPRIMMGECIGHRRPKSHSLSRNSWKRV